jgi:L,D-transpeptidase ErfK/SrfK
MEVSFMLRIIIKVFILSSIIITFIALGGQYSKSLCGQSGYTCIKVGRGQTWERLWSNDEEMDIVMRLNRMNMELSPGMIIAVPNNLSNLDNMDIAPFSGTIDPSARNTVIVDINKQAFAAYDRAGYLIHWGPVSTARGWCPDVHRNCSTPRGTFYFYSKGGQGCYSSIYPVPTGGAPMPYCMYFYKGFALHASELPGYNASHGCIRLFYEDALWLNKNFVELGHFGTRVIVR